MRRLTGWILSALLAVFLLWDSGTKILKVPAVVQGSATMGFSADLLPPIGIALLISLVLFLIPRLVLLGGILLAAYFGGAVCAGLRAHAPTPYIIAPIVIGILVWVAIFLRDARFYPLLFGSTGD